MKLSHKHTPYSEIFGHASDFKVRYEFYTESEGGRQNLPHQGIRSDFWYEHENHDSNSDYMIYPEFLNSDGELINSGEVLPTGVATMWILNPEWRKYHQKRIEVGTIGFFKEGSRRTAKCEIIEIIGLHTNPVD